jgi:isoquinoline 1-oxidoreductase alpha subunit
MAKFKVDGRAVNSGDLDQPLLWFLRDNLDKFGVRFGCGMGLCGACSVMMDGYSTRSCLLQLKDLEGKDIHTIHGIGDVGGKAVQEAWVAEKVPQCGYCQSGQIVSATALLKSNPNPSEEDIQNAMSGNICRCGTYPRIQKAIRKAAFQLAKPAVSSKAKPTQITEKETQS